MGDDRMDITRRGYVVDNESDDIAYCVESVRVEDGKTVRNVTDMTGLIQGESHRSDEESVALWEIKGHIARSNLLAKLKRMPESRRREEDRRTAAQQRRRESAPDVCVSCSGSEWIDDEREGRGYCCPECQNEHG